MIDYRLPTVRSGGHRVIKFTVNNKECTFVAAPYISYETVVGIAFGWAMAADPRSRIGPIDYYGRSIGGGKLHRHESIHIENEMRFIVQINGRV